VSRFNTFQRIHLLQQLSSEWTKYGGIPRTSCAGDIKSFIGVTGVSEIYWLGTRPKVTLAVVSCPRGDEKLKSDLFELKGGGIDTIVSLLEKDEAAWLGLGDEGPLAEHTGLNFISFPIPDANVPLDPASFKRFVAELASRVIAGEKIGIHCRGCIGRATVLTACTLIQLGFTPDTALATVQAARGCAVPDTLEQERWILHYRPAL
jgi:protein-tyrosine phosphatase